MSLNFHINIFGSLKTNKMAEGNRLIMNIACVLVLVFSTHKTATAQKRTSNIKNYICMNAIQTQSQMDLKGFELKIPENWCTYIGFHDILSYSPKSLLNLSKNHYKNRSFYRITNWY